MTCEELGGACDLALTAETFAEIAQKSQNHAREMFAKNDQAHIEAMNKMMELMKTGSMDKWMSEKEEIFNSR